MPFSTSRNPEITIVEEGVRGDHFAEAREGRGGGGGSMGRTGRIMYECVSGKCSIAARRSSKYSSIAVEHLYSSTEVQGTGDIAPVTHYRQHFHARNGT